MYLFTDCSVFPKSKIGIGGYLFVEEISTEMDLLGDEIKLKKFENVTSTQLELKTFLWSLNELGNCEKEVLAYTDSKNILSLLDRRDNLEQKGFKNKQGICLKHAGIYREFYSRIDGLNICISKVKGHSRNSDKSEIEKIFSALDQSTRKALRALRKQTGL